MLCGREMRRDDWEDVSSWVSWVSHAVIVNEVVQHKRNIGGGGASGATCQLRLIAAHPGLGTAML